MKVAAWLAQDVRSPRRKVYGAVVWVDPSTGQPVFCTASGAEATIKNTTMKVIIETSPDRGAPSAAAPAFATKFDDRLHAGYKVVVDPCVFDYAGLLTEDAKSITRQVLRAVHFNGGDTKPSAHAAAVEVLGGAAAPRRSTPARRPRRTGNPAVTPPSLDPVTMPDGSLYYPRLIGGISDVALLHKARATLRMPVGLHGDTGSGKSTLPIAAFGADLLTIQGHDELTVAEMVGQFVPVPAGVSSASGFEWVDGPLLTAVKEGRPVLVDELTRIPGTTLAKLFSVMDFRRELTVDALGGQTFVAAPGFAVIGSWNNDGVSLHQIDPALRRRFPLIVHVENDYTAAQRRGVDSRLVRIAQSLDSVRRQRIADGDLPVWAPSVATLLDVQALLDAGLGDEIAANALLTACPDEDPDPLVVQKIEVTMGLTPTRLALAAVA